MRFRQPALVPPERRHSRIPVKKDRTVARADSSRPAQSTGLSRVVSFLAELPLAHPVVVVLVVLATLVPSAIFSGRLEVRSSFSELLPESRPSVIELKRVRARLAGVSTLIVAIEGRDEASLKRFVDELSPKIRALGPK